MAELNDLPGFTAASPSEQRPADSVYRPVALVAILGLAVSCLYAAFLVLTILVAMFRGSSPAVEIVILVVPLTGLALSAAGWLQVRRSEGTLTGERLAVWGMGVSLLSGLVHVAIAAASYLAIHQQADAVAQQWLGLLRQQEYARAFRLMLPPDQRPADGANLRKEVELRFNTSEGGGKGPFGQFLRQDVCQFLGQGGDNTRIEPKGIVDGPRQEGGGIRVTLAYRVSTPEASADVGVTLQAIEGRNRGEVRQWVVRKDGSGIREGRLEPTALGKRVMQLREQSGPVAAKWFQNMTEGQNPDLTPEQRAQHREAAYLLKVEPARREQVRGDYQARQALTELANLPNLWLGRPALTPELEDRWRFQQALRDLPGYRRFLQGEWVQDDPETFWAPDEVRPEFPTEVKKALREKGGLLFRGQEMMPGLWKKEKDQVQFSYESPLVVGTDDKGLPKYLGEARLVVEADASALESSGGVEWRLARLDLVRASSAGKSSQAPPMRGGRGPQ